MRLSHPVKEKWFMKGKSAGLWFLGLCAVLAILLLSRLITPMIGGILFAISLGFLGGISRGFRKP